MPFPENNFAIFSREISTRYKDRNRNLEQISTSINEFINSKKGNYFIFFPSYAYLEEVYNDYKLKFDDEILLQDRSMSEKDIKKFIKNFDE